MTTFVSTHKVSQMLKISIRHLNRLITEHQIPVVCFSAKRAKRVKLTEASIKRLQEIWK